MLEIAYRPYLIQMKSGRLLNLLLLKLPLALLETGTEIDIIATTSESSKRLIITVTFDTTGTAVLAAVMAQLCPAPTLLPRGKQVLI